MRTVRKTVVGALHGAGTQLSLLTITPGVRLRNGVERFSRKQGHTLTLGPTVGATGNFKRRMRDACITPTISFLHSAVARYIYSSPTLARTLSFSLSLSLSLSASLYIYIFSL